MKDQNSFLSKNKGQKQKENPFNIYKANKRNLKSRLSDKKVNKKTLASSSTSYPNKNKSSILSSIKPLYSYKETFSKVYNKLNTVLHSYNMSKEAINIKITNDIIFDERKRIVSVFKDYLLWDETSDFFKQYYKKNKSIKLILRFITYYETYTKFYPEYGPHEDILKILKKNIKKKRKLYEKIEEDVTKNFKNDKNGINKPKFERLIKDSEIKLSKVSSNDFHIKNSKNSKSTLILDSIDENNLYNNNINNNKDNKSIGNNNKDFYYILKAFIDNDDKIYENKEVYNTNNINNYDNIFIFNSKLSKYFKKSSNEEKNQEKKTDRYIIIGTNSKQKKINMNILNNIVYQKIRPKSDDKVLKITDKGNKIYKEICLNQKSSNNKKLMKTVNKSSKMNNKNTINESNSISAYKKQYLIKYNEQTHVTKMKPQNIKKFFNSSNKYEKCENNSIGNYYNLFPCRNTEGNERSRKSRKSLLNTSPIYLIKKKNNLIINTIRNKNIYNYERLKEINNINQINFTDRKNNFSENENNNNSYYNTDSNNLHLKFKYSKNTKNSSNIGKDINIPKKNKITKISQINQIKNNNPKKKNKHIINKIGSENPFKIDNSSTINNKSTNRNITLMLKQKSKKNYSNKVSITTNNKDEIKHISKIKDKYKNNIIIIKSNLNPSEKKPTSLNKKNKLTIKNSLPLNDKNKSVSKTIKNIYININDNNNNEESEKDNYYIKSNNILKNTIKKSNSKNELNKKKKINNNNILKSCCSNTNNSAQKNNFIFEDFDQSNINKRDNVRQLSFLDFYENSFLKNTIKNKYEINNNSSKKARICLRLPMANNINKI